MKEKNEKEKKVRGAQIICTIWGGKNLGQNSLPHSKFKAANPTVVLLPTSLSCLSVVSLSQTSIPNIFIVYNQRGSHKSVCITFTSVKVIGDVKLLPVSATLTDLSDRWVI